MAYYLGITPQQADPGQAQNPYFTLGQQSYSVGGGVPSSQSYMGSNPLLQNYAGSMAPQKMGAAGANMAQSLDQVPTEVLQSQERYRPGSAGLGDQESSLFDRSLLGQYNQWQGSYGKFGDQFQPWSLAGAGSGGGGYNPSQVDLLNPINQKEQMGQGQNYYDPTANQVRMGYDQFDPITGKQTSTANRVNLPTIQGTPSMSLGAGGLFGVQNYGDFSNKNLGNIWNQFSGQGISNLPDYGTWRNNLFNSAYGQQGVDWSGIFGGA